jgi:Xaa-Pro aminopeptidase
MKNVDQQSTSKLRQEVLDSFPSDSRFTRIQKLLAAKSLDCVVAVGGDYATWLTGYHRYLAGLNAVVLTADGNVTLFISPEEVDVAREINGGIDIQSFGEGGFGLDLDSTSTLLAALRGFKPLRDAKGVGFAGVSASAANDLGWSSPVGLDDELVRIAQRKDRDEAEKIAVAYNLCWEAHRAVETAVNEGASELEIFTRAQSVAQLTLGQPIEFVADVLAGANTAQVCCPIAVAGAKRVEVGEPLIADIAVRAAGYWGDTCRTYVRGENDEIRGGLEMLTKILGDATLELRPGVPANEVHRNISRALEDVFPGSEFPHHGGHGIGLSCWQGPHIIPADSSVFEPGMIVAVEPGVYFANRWGIRRENEYLITENGGVELNEALASIGSQG